MKPEFGISQLVIIPGKKPMEKTGVVACTCGTNFESRYSYPEAGVILFTDPCPDCGEKVEEPVDITDDTVILI